MLNLKEWRAHWGLTQTKAADSIGVTERHYRRLETGRAPINRRLALILQARGAYDHMTIE